MADRKGIPVFVVEWRNRNICRELVTGFFSKHHLANANIFASHTVMFRDS